MVVVVAVSPWKSVNARIQSVARSVVRWMSRSTKADSFSSRASRYSLFDQEEPWHAGGQ